MARFKYKGEITRPYVETYGSCLKIRLKKQDGTVEELVAPNPETGFPINQDIGVDITDLRTLRYMRNDPRFEEIL
jgi:hypothetical protein